MDGKHKKIIEKVENLFNEGEVENALSTYKQLFEKYPKERDVYIQYLDYLEDEFVMAELAWTSFDDKIETCNMAIENLEVKEHFIFHIVKLDAYIFLMENNPEWFLKNKNKIMEYIHRLLDDYPKEAEIYRRKSHIEYYLGDTKAALIDINKAIEYSDGKIDERVYINRDAYLLQLGHNEKVIEGYETRLKDVDTNDTGQRKSIYTILIKLYDNMENKEKTDYYKKLLKELE